MASTCNLNCMHGGACYVDPEDPRQMGCGCPDEWTGQYCQLPNPFIRYYYLTWFLLGLWVLTLFKDHIFVYGKKAMKYLKKKRNVEEEGEAPEEPDVSAASTPPLISFG
uniref:EGF-like domain-containing protein n=1 Tax=Steinernema glaseri TaxID=37863 RepID=A0A1I7ZTA5_9BILA